MRPARAKQDAKDKKLEYLQNKLTAITGINFNTWILSQVNFLLKQFN